MGSGFFSKDNPPPLEQAPAGPGPGNVVVQEPTGVDGPTASFFGRGASPQLQAFEEDAKQSAEAAEASATAAAGSASTATTKAAEASTSATNAAASASTATTKASEASTSATNAANSATAAGTSATNAASSASAAGTSATNAANSATSASNSATAASASATSAVSAQTAAESARDATLAAFDNFDDRYLGTKASNPTLDNDGNALVAGALYFNSTVGEMRVYTGSAWTAAYVSGTGVLLINNNLSDLGNVATARTNLGLATVAATGAYADLSGKPTNVSAFANDAGYLLSYTESDPTVPSFVKTITATNILNWNTAYGWGNHADAGYLLAYTESDPTVPSFVKTITATNILNWNTAYGWGNHASAGYLTGITSGQVTTALGYTPANRAGDTFTGAVALPSNGLTVGTNQFAVSGGNVGIGTASPSYRLHINSGTSTTTGFFQSSGTDSFIGLSNANYTVYLGSSNDGSFRIQTPGNSFSDKLTIDLSGNVGIGTSSITAGYKLDVAGSANASGSFVSGAGTTNQTLVGNKTLLFYNTSVSEGVIRSADDASTFTSIGVSKDVLRFATQNTERMRIDASGNFLVGTSSAYAKLTVAGSDIATNALVSGATRGVRIGANSTYGYIEGVDNTGSASYQPLMLGGSDVRFSTSGVGTERMRIDASGNLLVGTTSATAGYLASINGALTLGNGSSLSWGGAYNSGSPTIAGSTNLLAFYPNGASSGEKMRIDASGNVGIGTTAPASKLHVSGSYITAGSVSSTGGSKILAGEYSNAEHITTFGSDYSSGGPVIGYGVWPSTTSSGAFISSAAVNIQRSAYLISGQTHIWYSGAAQNIAVGSAVTVTERMRIDGSGNLGVGRVSPDARLSVDSGSLDAVATFNSTGNTYIQLQRSGSGHVYLQATAGAAYLWNQQNTPFLFGTNNTEKMRLTSSGQLFVGTNSITTKFAVIGYDATYNNTATFGSGLASQYLDILCGFALTNGTPGGVASNTTMTLRSSGGSVGELAFATGNTEQMRITSGGNVGIGTSSPAAKLDVLGASSDQIRVRTAGTEFYRFGRNSSTGYMDFYGSQTGYTGYTFGGVDGERMRIDSSGNVGIGTTSISYRLQVAAPAGAQNIFLAGQTGVSNGYTIISNGTSLTHQWYKDGAEAMRLDTSGNLGIGLTNPSSKLHVSGDILATGNVTAYSDERLKDDVATIQNALDLVASMRGVTYVRKDTGEAGVGVIAQEMQAVMPQVVRDGEYMSVAYGNLVGVLIQAIKELRAEVQQLKGN